MAITASGLHVATFVDALDDTQLALDLSLETHKYAMFDNTITPDFDASAASAAYGAGAYASGEVYGTGWAQGGILLTGTTLTGASGTATFDATDISEPNTTLTGARGGLLYAAGLAGNNAILLQNFGQDFDTINGTFDVVFHALGLVYWDLTP